MGDLWQISMAYDGFDQFGYVNLLDETGISDLVVGANTYGKHCQANDEGTIGHH